MSQQQANINILTTRPLPEDISLACENASIHLDSISFIETQRIISPGLTIQLQQLATQSLYIVFTSANAVTAVADSIKKTTADWKIFCISGKTKDTVTQYFPEATIIASARSAIALANCIYALRLTKTVVFFTGDHHLADLPDTLSASGIEVKTMIVYQTIQTPVAITKLYDAILFFSPSAVASFFSLNTISSGVTLFSIGSTTTAALLQHTGNQIITSPSPDPTALVNAAISFYNANTNNSF